MTWDELLDKFAASRRRKPLTVRHHRNNLQIFLNFSKAATPRDVTPAHLADYYRDQKQKVSSVTAGIRLRTVLTLLRWAVRQEYLAFDPGEGLSVPKPRYRIPRILTVDEVNRLLAEPAKHRQAFVGVRDAAILEVLYGCGLRACELVALDVDQVDLADNTLKVAVSKSQPRLMPFGKSVAAALTIYLERRRDVAQPLERAAFVSPYGYRMPAGVVSSVVRRYATKLGIPDATGHALRRAYATHMLENGANIVELKALLGHADLDSTMAYAHVLPTEMLRAYRQTHPRARADRRKPQ